MKDYGIVTILAMVTLLVTINPVSALDTLNVTLCNNIGGTWAISTNTCSLGDVNSGFPITMTIPAGAKFVVNGNIVGTPMAIIIDNGGIFDVNGNIDPTARLDIINNGTFNIYGYIEDDESIANSNHGVINIHGSLVGIYTLDNDGTINNYGRLLNYGGTSNSGTGIINNNGIFDTLSAVEFDNSGIINNYDTFKNGAITNTGNIINFCGGTISNPGIIGPNTVIYETSCNSIPEFPTVVLPAIAIMGLIFLLQRRKAD